MERVAVCDISTTPLYGWLCHSEASDCHSWALVACLAAASRGDRRSAPACSGPICAPTGSPKSRARCLYGLPVRPGLGGPGGLEGSGGRRSARGRTRCGPPWLARRLGGLTEAPLWPVRTQGGADPGDLEPWAHRGPRRERLRSRVQRAQGALESQGAYAAQVLARAVDVAASAWVIGRYCPRSCSHQRRHQGTGGGAGVRAWWSASSSWVSASSWTWSCSRSARSCPFSRAKVMASVVRAAS